MFGGSDAFKTIPLSWSTMPRLFLSCFGRKMVPTEWGTWFQITGSIRIGYPFVNSEEPSSPTRRCHPSQTHRHLFCSNGHDAQRLFCSRHDNTFELAHSTTQATMGGSLADVASFGDPLVSTYDVAYMKSTSEIGEHFDVKAAITNDTAVIML